MTEEEKKAIEELEEFIEDNEILNISVFTAEKIKKIIEKQQKEIEEKTTILFAGAEKVKQLEKEIEELKKHKEHEQEYIDGELFSAKQIYYIGDNYISKYKIREKVKVLEDKINRYSCHNRATGFPYTRGKIEALQELLKEEPQDD